MKLKVFIELNKENTKIIELGRQWGNTVCYYGMCGDLMNLFLYK